MSRARPHPPEVKAEALRRLAEGDRPSLVARDLGVSVDSLRHWRTASGHVNPDKGRRGPGGRFLPGYTPNPGGSTASLERAQRLLEEAAPKHVERLLGLADQLHQLGAQSKPGRLDLDEGRWAQETRATLEAVLKPLARSIASRAEAERLRAEVELERERARVEAERADAARLDLTALTDEELEILERLHAKARRA